MWGAIAIKNFAALLKADFHRAFLSAGFVIGVLSTLAVFYIGSIGMVSSIVSATAGFNNAYKYNNIENLFFLVATFAYSASFCVDWQTRFVYPLLMKSGKTAYALSKCIANAISGGVAVSIGAILFIVYLCLAQPSILPEMYAIEMEFSWQAFGDLLMAQQPFLFFLAYVYVIFLQGAFFSTLGLLLSGYLPNRYVAYISPFALSFLFNQAANSLRLPVWLDPVKMATAPLLDTPTPILLAITTACFLSFTVVCCALFIRVAKRRIAHG